MSAIISDAAYRALLDLVMASDPSPLDDEADNALVEFADAEARSRGYDGWAVAYHEFGKEAT